MPRIAPTTWLEIPIPIICIEVVTPMAEPTVEPGTTSGMEGHNEA